MNIVITGGAGFIGSALCEFCLNHGHRVVCFDNLSRGSIQHLEGVADDPNFTFVTGDLRNEPEVDAVMRHQDSCDLIFHLGAVNGTKLFHEQASHVIDVNINGTMNVLNAAAKQDARVVIASSAEALGLVEQMPLKEHQSSIFPDPSLHQRFSYGASKYIDELLAHHAVAQGLDVRIIRPFNVFGPSMSGNVDGQVIGIMFQAIQNGQPLIVHGNGTQTRSFTFIDDIVRGIYLAGTLDSSLDDHTSLTGMVFNFGSDEEVSMIQLAQSINHTVGSLAQDIVFQAGYPGDSPRRVAQCENAHQHLKWAPKINLLHGLQLMWSRLQR